MPHSLEHSGSCVCGSGYNQGGGICSPASCPANSHLVPTDLCLCDFGYKDNDNSPQVNCVGNNNSACTGGCSGCDPNTYDDAGVCKCNPGLINIDSTDLGITCKSCSNSQAQCDVCYGYTASGASLTIKTGNNCECTAGYYDNDPGVFSDCRRKDYAACYTDCLKCTPNTKAVGTTCICASGYYDMEPTRALITCVCKLEDSVQPISHYVQDLRR
jgi:hypothetical protein